VLLGDRIAPTDIRVRNGGIVVDYADRHPAEPMSATPYVDKKMVLLLDKYNLSASVSFGEKDLLFEGWVTIGHEVRSFKPCIIQMDLWLMGQSPDLQAIMAAYRQAMPAPKHYRPIFMVLAGKQVEPPTHGFGADYDGAFMATRLVRVTPGANCGNDSEDIDTANGFMHKITFDLSTLDEDGLYGPIGGKPALSYEFCIPNTVADRTEVGRIDPTVAFFEQSPGRIGCASWEMLCIGSTHQSDYATVLQQLAELPYVQRIDESVFE
jgi:hypothetical protein